MLHPVQCTHIICLFEFQVWVNDSEGDITEQICDDSGEDPNCCRFSGSFSQPNNSNLVFLASNYNFCSLVYFLGASPHGV